MEPRATLELVLQPEQSALIQEAASLAQQDAADFVLSSVLPQAAALVARRGPVPLSVADTDLVSDLLENPPLPNDRLKRAAQAVPGAQ